MKQLKRSLAFDSMSSNLDSILSVIMLSAVVKSFIKLTAIMLSVVILSVAAPFSTQSYYCNENCASEKKMFYHFNNLECLTQ